jgi:hypothetical protein
MATQVYGRQQMEDRRLFKAHLFQWLRCKGCVFLLVFFFKLNIITEQVSRKEKWFVQKLWWKLKLKRPNVGQTAESHPCRIR